MTWNPARRWAGGEQTPFFPAQCRPLGMEPLHPWSVRIQGYKDATGVNVLFFFFGCATWLAGSWFSNQGWKPGPGQ